MKAWNYKNTQIMILMNDNFNNLGHLINLTPKINFKIEIWDVKW